MNNVLDISAYQRFQALRSLFSWTCFSDSCCITDFAGVLGGKGSSNEIRTDDSGSQRLACKFVWTVVPAAAVLSGPFACQDYTLDAPVVPMARAKDREGSVESLRRVRRAQVLGKSTYAAIPTRCARRIYRGLW